MAYDDFDDTIGVSPERVVENLIRDRDPGLDSPVNPETVLNRLIRKTGATALARKRQQQTPPPVEPQDFGAPGPQQSVQPSPQKTEPTHPSPPQEGEADFSEYGTPAAQAPQGGGADFSEYGTPAEGQTQQAQPTQAQDDAALEVAGQAGGMPSYTTPPPTQQATPEQREWPGYTETAISGLGSGLSHGAGATLKGAESANKALADVAPLVRTLPIVGPAALAAQGIGALSGGAEDPRKGAIYQAGENLQKQADAAFPMSETQKQSITGRVAEGLGGLAGMAPAIVAGTAVGGPAVGTAVGAGLMGLQSAGDAFDAAIQKGATVEQAQKAAVAMGGAGAALGAIPLHLVFKPIEKLLPAWPGFAGWAVERLAHAAQTGVAFAGIGEMQEFLAEQLATTYGPDAGYSFSTGAAGYAKNFDVRRVIASLLTGAAMGAFGGAGTRPRRPEVRLETEDDLRNRRREGEPPPPPGDERQGEEEREPRPPPGPPHADEFDPRFVGNKRTNPNYKPTRDNYKSTLRAIDPTYTDAHLAAMSNADLKAAIKAAHPDTEKQRQEQSQQQEQDYSDFGTAAPGGPRPGETGGPRGAETAGAGAATGEARTGAQEPGPEAPKRGPEVPPEGLSPEEFRAAAERGVVGPAEPGARPNFDRIARTPVEPRGTHETLIWHRDYGMNLGYSVDDIAHFAAHYYAIKNDPRYARQYEKWNRKRSGQKPKIPESAYAGARTQLQAEAKQFGPPKPATAETIRQRDEWVRHNGEPVDAVYEEAPEAGQERDQPAGDFEAANARLREAGYSDDVIKGWSPKQRAARLAEIEPEGDGSRNNPIELRTAEDLERATSIIDEDHTHRQGEAGNFQQAHATWNGIRLKLQTGAGGTRRWTVPETGEPGESTMASAYGEDKDALGNDGDNFDYFVGRHLDSPHVFVLDEKDRESGLFRQHKGFIGFRSPEEALAAYLGSTGKTKGEFGGLAAFSVDHFKEWKKNPANLKKPVEQAPAEGAQAAENKEEPAATPPPAAGPESEGGGTSAPAGHRTSQPPEGQKVSPENDTGQNVPETDATLRAQQEQLVKGERAVQMFPKGTRELPLPKGMQRVDTPRGVFHYDPKQVDAGQIRTLSDQGRENELLGLGPFSKDDVAKRMEAGEKPATVVERDQDGNEVRSAAGTEQTAPEQTAAMDAAKSPGNTVGVEPLEQVLADRQKQSRVEPEHYGAVEAEYQRAGVNLNDVPPAHIAEAAEIMRDEGHSAPDAIQIAAGRAAVRDGLPPDQVRKIYGPKADAILEPKQPSERGVRSPSSSAAAGGEAAPTEQQHPEGAARGGEGGETPRAQAGEGAQDHERHPAGEAGGAGGEGGRGTPDRERGASSGERPAGVSEAAKPGQGRPAKGPRAPRVIKGPVSLLPFIAARGGLAPTPDLRHMGLDESTRAIAPNQGPRPVLRKGGLSLHELTEQMREAGYVENQPEGMPDTLTEADILDMIAEEMRGNKQFPIGQEHGDRHAQERADDESRYMAERDAGHRLDDFLTENSFGTILDEDRNLAIQLMVDHGLSPDDALDRALVTNELNSGMVEPDAPHYDELEETFSEPQSHPAPGSREVPAQEGGERAGEGAAEVPQAGGHAPGAGETGGEKPANERLTEAEQAAIDALPKLNENHTRLYRGEYAGEPKPLPEWLKQAQDERGITNARGRWFTDKPEIAKWYVHEAGDHGHMVYIDVTTHFAERSRVAGSGVAKFSRDPDNEFFLSGNIKPKPIPNWPTKGEPTTEATPAGEQTVIPGAEKITEGEQAQRKADEKLKPTKAQKPADEGLFGDESKQTDLVDMAREKEREPKATKETPAARAERELTERGATRVGGVDYQIHEGRGGGIYYTRVEKGVRIEKGGVIPGGGGWSRAQAIREAMKDVEGDLAASQPQAHIPTEETAHERGEPGAPGEEALGPVAAEEGGRPEAGGPSERSPAGSGAAGAEGNRPPDEGQGVSGPRGGGGGAEAPHPARPRARGGSSGVGAKRTRGSRKGIPEEPADVAPEEAPSLPKVNFRITDEVELGKGGETVKFNDNLAAIRILKAIERDGRRATADEQRALARYVGWGGLANAFSDKPEWKARAEELASLLTKEEMHAARRSTRNAHYTSKAVIDAMWKAVDRLGFRGGLTMELSSGTGNFLGLVPDHLAGNTRFIGVEYDSLTQRIAQQLYPQDTILHSGLQYVPLSDGEAVLNIGNPPFGSEKLHFKYKPEYNEHSIHNQFFLAGLDVLQPGGIHAAVVSRYLLDAQDPTSRREMAARGKLLGAIRLPETAFRENARTDVVTDIVFMQRHTPAEERKVRELLDTLASRKSSPDEKKTAAAELPDWIDTSTIKDPAGEDVHINSYFAMNRHMVLGKFEFVRGMHKENELSVTLEKGADISKLLDEAIARLPKDVLDLNKEVLDRSIARHEKMAEALKIAVEGHEPGHIEVKDGKLSQVYERETPSGGFEMARRGLGPTTPWSKQLFQDAEGRWYALEPQLKQVALREVAAQMRARAEAEDKLQNVSNAHHLRLQAAEAEKQAAAAKPDEKYKTAQGRLIYKRTYFENNEVPQGQRLGVAKFKRLRELVDLRDLTKRQLVLESEDAPAKDMEANRAKLRAAYEGFTKRHGLLNDQGNSSLVSEMPDGALVQALELNYRRGVSEAKAKRLGEKPKPASATPAPILKTRVVPKFEPVQRVQTPAEALQVSLSDFGHIDMDRIAGLLGVPKERAIEMMTEGPKPLVYLDPEAQQHVPRDAYLTGHVVQKLKAAQAAGLEDNVRDLKAVQPERWTAEQVQAVIGANWVPPKVYEDFIQHLAGGKGTVKYHKLTNAFEVDVGVHGDSEKLRQWRTDDASFQWLLGRLLNSRAIKIYTEPDENGTRYLDQELTALAQLKANEISNEFSEWVFRDTERRNKLVDIFNTKFNTRVTRQWDGQHLSLPGKVPDAVIRLRRNQLNAAWRGIQSKFVLYDHVVGAGKTFTGVATIMERRRMGLSKKPMVVVPNHLVSQWTSDFYRLYPAAKVLAAGANQFDRTNRRKLFAKIATGDWDAVIVPHSSFFFINISPDTELRFLTEELRMAQEAIKEAQEAAAAEGYSGRRKPLGVKEAEALANRIQGRIDALKGRKKDNLLTFEQMGVDYLMVDEAHEFKNLFYSSNLTGVRGMGTKSGSKKAFDLYTKIRTLRENPNGAVAFATGTPISNSAVEMYTMLRYLAPDELRELGLENFDAWRSQYVTAEAKFEPTEAGGLKEVTRLGRSWSNMRSLMELYYSVTDAVTQGDLDKWYAEDNKGERFPVPKVKTGGRKEVVVKPTKEQERILQEIVAGFNDLPNEPDPDIRNAERLRLMDRARKVSLDARAASRFSPSKEEGGKLDVISDNVARIYKHWDKDAGTQLVFLDRSVPKSKGDDKLIAEYDALMKKREEAILANDEDALQTVQDALDRFNPQEIEELRAAQAGGWNAYDQLKRNLIARGIPADEIRFVQEAQNDAEKKALFDAVNDGTVRVLIGSTPRMGAGTNVQERIVGLHHADVTWKPSDIEQREGRGIRQGNSLLDKYGDDFELEILAYATERTIDAKMWDLNSQKLKMINGIRKYEGAFNMDFDDEDSVDMAEIAALASGDPLQLERVKTAAQIGKLELLERAYRRQHFGLDDRIHNAEEVIKDYPRRIKEVQQVSRELDAGVAAMKAKVDARRVTIDGQEYPPSISAEQAWRNSISEQQAGDENAKFTVNVNGKRLTSKSAIEDALKASLGDWERPFEATIDGKTVITRAEASKAIAEKANKIRGRLDSEMKKYDEEKIGSLIGYDLHLYVDQEAHTKGGETLSLILKKDGKDVAQGNHERDEKGDFSPAGARAALDHLVGDVNEKVKNDGSWMAWKVEEAKRDLPGLKEDKKKPFAQAEELKKKRDRLREIINELDARTKAAEGKSAPQGTTVAMPDWENEPPPRQALPPGLYSQVERVIAGEKTKVASPQQWIATLRNRPGIKVEEMDWLGLPQWIASHDKPITKQEMLDYVRANSIEIKEITKGGEGANSTLPTDIDEWSMGDTVDQGDGTTLTVMKHPSLPDDTYISILHDENGEVAGYEPVVDGHATSTWHSFDSAAHSLQGTLGQEEGGAGTKFGQYKLPGGENYREVLLTLPPRPRQADHEAANAEYKELMQRESDGTASNADLARADELNIPPDPAFRESHWSEPNVLAHVRFDDRVGPNGEKVLHVAEFQSDWHQKGRERGYRDEKVLADAREKIKGLYTELHAVNAQINARVLGRRPGPLLESLHEKRGELNAEISRLESLGDRAVPDAPFKTTWPELALKRVLRYAAEHGYDRLTWDTGETQAQRYGLEHYVNEVSLRPVDTVDGRHVYELEALDHDDRSVLKRDVADQAELAGIVGKEIAAKLITEATRINGRTKLRGDVDLTIGGEGQREFYDRIMPSLARKLVKPFGGEVGRSVIPRSDVGDPNNPTGWETTGTPAGTMAGPFGVHSIDITPQMRGHIMSRGFPVFDKPKSKLEPKGVKYVPVPKNRLHPAAVEKLRRIEAFLRQLIEHQIGRKASVEFPFRILIDKGAVYGHDKDFAQASGTFTTTLNIIRLALDQSNARWLLESTYHETFHAIQDLLLTDQEAALLKRYGPELRAYAIANNPRLADKIGPKTDQFEIEAMAYQTWSARRATGESGAGSGLHVGIRWIFEKIRKLLERLKNFLHGLGWQTWEDVYQSAYEGRMKGRQSRADQGFGSRLEEIHQRAQAEAAAKRPGMRAKDYARAMPEEPIVAAEPHDPGTTPPPTVPQRIRQYLEGDTATWLIEHVSNLSHRVRMLQNEVERRFQAGVIPQGSNSGERIGREPVNSLLPDVHQFYTAKRLFPGRVGYEVGEFNKDHLDPLKDYLKGNGITLDQAGEYLYALHAEERNAKMGEMYPADHQFRQAPDDDTIVGGSGMSKQEADEIIDRYENGPNGQAFRDLEPRIEAIRNHILNQMVRYGLESRATVDAWRRMYEHYAPLRGWEVPPPDAPEDYGVGGQFNVRGRETKQAFGRRSRADNPLVNLIDQAYRTIERGERLRFLRSLVAALRSLGADARDIVTFNQGREKKVVNPNTGLVEKVSDFADRYRDEAVHYKIGGESRYMVFKDKKLAMAIKRMNPYGLGHAAILLKALNKLKALWTHYSPEFMLRHFAFRYPIEGLLNAQELRESGDFSSSQYIKDALPIVGNAVRTILAVERGGFDPANPLHVEYREMKREGGTIAFRQSRDLELLREHLDKALADLSGRPDKQFRAWWHRGIEKLDRYTNAWDNALRLSVYSQAKRQGMTPQKAALRARDATIDYQLRGLLSNVLGLFMPFFNTAIRTGTRMGAALARSKIMRGLFLGLIGANIAVGLWNYLVGGNDKDGTPLFEKIPPWERELNFILMDPLDHDAKGRMQPIKIPMPYNWALPLNIGNSIIGMILGKEGIVAHAESMLKSVAMAFSPLGETGNLYDYFTPEALRTPAHIYENKNWRGRPLHEDFFFQKGPNAYSGFKPINGYERTGEGWKKLAEFVNDISGGNRHKSGLLDLHPEDYREAFDQFFGAQRRIAGEAYDTGHSWAQGQSANPARVPMARVFRGADYDQADRAAAAHKRFEAKHPWLQ